MTSNNRTDTPLHSQKTTMSLPTDFDSIAAEVLTRLAATKQRPAVDIDLDTPLEDLQVDSLDKVSLAFDIEEAYNISIPESALSTIRTPRNIVTGIQTQLKKQETPTECA